MIGQLGENEDGQYGEKDAQQRRIRELLAKYSTGDVRALDELLPYVMREIRAIAHRMKGSQRPGHTWATTDLVHEAYVKLRGGSGGPLESQAHLRQVIAKAMEWVLIDHAKRRKTQKRGGDAIRVPLDDIVDSMEESVGDLGDLVDLGESLKRLELQDPELAELVRYRFFEALSMAEISKIVEIPERSLHRRWEVARYWLHRDMRGGAKGSSAE